MDAAAADFLKHVASGTEAVAFIGHSVLINTRPEWGSVGLTFFDKAIVKTMQPEQPKVPGFPTQNQDKIPSKARIIFIAACQTTDIFKSLWDIDSGTTDRGLIVPVGADTNLYWAAQGWRKIAEALGNDKTASPAVAAGNAYLASENESLRFQVIGGQNVRIR